MKKVAYKRRPRASGVVTPVFANQRSAVEEQTEKSSFWWRRIRWSSRREIATLRHARFVEKIGLASLGG